MALPDLDSSVGHSFGLEVDGITIKSITEVSGLKMEQDVVELKQNGPDGKYDVKKLPGRPKAGECTLTRGLTGDQSFEKWVSVHSPAFGLPGSFLTSYLPSGPFCLSSTTSCSIFSPETSVMDLMVMPSNSRPKEWPTDVSSSGSAMAQVLS